MDWLLWHPKSHVRGKKCERTVNIKRKDKEGQASEDAETEMETVAAARSPCKP